MVCGRQNTRELICWSLLNPVLNKTNNKAYRPLADPDLHKRTKFLNDFFKNFPKKFLHSRKNSTSTMYLPKFLMTFFCHRPFSCFIWYFYIGGGVKSVANIATGGPNPYFSTKSQYY